MSHRGIGLALALTCTAAPLAAHQTQSHDVGRSIGSGRGSARAVGSGDGKTIAVAGGPQEPQQGWLGFSFSCDDCALQRAPRERAAWTFHSPPVVMWVDSDGPAYRAGLRSGDTLTAIDGTSLTTAEGGRAFGRIVAGQRITLAYRRGGRERQATVTVGQRPEVDAYAAVIGQYREQIEQQRRDQQEQMRRAQEEMLRAERELERLQRLGLRRNLTGLDSSNAALDSSRLRLLAAESTLRALQALQEPGAWTATPRAGRGGKYLPGYAPSPPVAAMPAMPATPSAPSAPAAPAAPTAPSMPPMPAMPTWSAPPPLAPREFSRFGNLRYSGRLRDIVNVEARGPGGVNVNEVGDSLVVVTSGDLSVRVALRQGGLTTTAPPPTLLTTTPTPPTTGVVSSQAGDMVSGISAVRLGNEAAAGLRVPPGYLIMTVSAGSHADSLGIAPGDVLIEINGSPVRLGGFAAPARPRGGQAGAAAATVMRAGERRTLRLGTPPRRRPI